MARNACGMWYRVTHVADDPERADRSRDVHAGEGGDAGSAGVEDVVLALEGVLLAAKAERELGEPGNRIAVDGVLSVPRLGGADPTRGVSDTLRVSQTRTRLLLVEHLGNVGGHDDQRRSGVDGRAGALQLELLVAKANLLKLDLPVTLTADGHILDLASVGRLVDTAKDGVASVLLGRAEAEGEDGLVEETLVEHVVEGGHDVVDRDGVVR
jgi:hypothetical protein